MNLCQAHWDKLRAAIAARGLERFVAPSGEAVQKRVIEQLQPEPNPRAAFEPLINASVAILNNAMMGTPAGLALLVAGEDGKPPCPLCFINHARHEAAQTDPAGKDRWARADDTAFYDEWIDRAADDQLARAKELGLVGAS